MKYKLKFPSVKVILTVIILCFLSLGIGFEIGKAGFQAELNSFPKVHISRQTPVKDLDFSLFWKVWDELNTSYFDKSKLIQSKMVYGAIQGMVASLEDPYTMFLPPSFNQVTNQDLSGKFEGVGIEIGFKGNQLAVISPLPGSPAEKAGVKPGDLIVGIKDTNKKVEVTTENISLGQAVEYIRGIAGSKVTLLLVREGSDKPISVDLIREKINVPSVKLEFVGENHDIAHLSILKFGMETPLEWQKAVQEINKKSNTKGIILDLRNNPGGYLQDSVSIAGEFLPTNSIAVIQQKVDGTKEEIRTDRSGSFVNSKVVVLVNGGSASASEILAGALRDDRKIKLIGEKTFGKGTIQEPLDLDGGAGLHITIAKWLTPNSTWVHGNGLDPDIKVKADPNSQVDAQLNAAIKEINY